MNARTVTRRVFMALALPIIIIVLWWLGTLNETNPFVPKPVNIVNGLVTVWAGPLLV